MTRSQSCFSIQPSESATSSFSGKCNDIIQRCLPVCERSIYAMLITVFPLLCVCVWYCSWFHSNNITTLLLQHQHHKDIESHRVLWAEAEIWVQRSRFPVSLNTFSALQHSQDSFRSNSWNTSWKYLIVFCLCLCAGLKTRG